MAKRTAKSIQQLISEQKLRIAEIEEKLNMQIYFETMPEYGPTYTYSYDISNFGIPYPQQSVDSWVRAIIKHMATRRRGHGGAISKAVVISIPENLTKDNINQWLSYQTEKIRKRAVIKNKLKEL